MGFTVDFSPQALQDLEAAIREIAKDSQERAESFGIELIDKTDVLEDFPYAGKSSKRTESESFITSHIGSFMT